MNSSKDVHIIVVLFAGGASVRLRINRAMEQVVGIAAHTTQLAMSVASPKMARAGKSDGAPSRTVCVRDDASEPTWTYSWRVLEGVLSL